MRNEIDELQIGCSVLDEEEFVDPEILHTKFPIVDWESQSLGNMHVYKIIRVDGNTSYHKTFESMLNFFDRHDLEVLHRLVMERFQDNTPEGYNLMLWGDLKILIPQEEEVHEKPSDETKVLVQEKTPTGIIEEHGSGEKGEIEISTANIQASTASPTKLSMDEELARKMEEEERLNLEAAREFQRQLDQRQENKPVSIAQARRNMITYLKNQGGYKESYFKKMSYNDIRPIFERKKRRFKEEDVNPEPVLIEKKAVGIRRKTLGRRRASDKQVPDEEEFVDLEVLHTKFPIVDWESQNLGNMHVYKIIRADGNTNNTPEGYNLMLWGDLKILVDPEQDDDI
ncbi:hypothetical protein Tco_0060096 [Tanacetum coccineum]